MNLDEILPKQQKRFNSRELAEAFGQSSSFFDNARSSNKGPNFIKMGDDDKSRVVYLRSDVEAWAKNHYHVTEDMR